MKAARAGAGAADDLIAIARVARPQGRFGEVIAEMLTDFPERFAGLKSAYLKRPAGEAEAVELERTRLHKGRVVLKIRGVESIDDADALREALLMVERDELVSLPADTYYTFELAGCAVELADGTPFGTVSEVRDYGAAPLLVVRDAEGAEHLIPLAISICPEIDVAGRRIRIDPPEGLLEL